MNPNSYQKNVLVLYEAGSTQVNTIREYLMAFDEYSKHNMIYAPASRSAQPVMLLDCYQAIIIHYSIRFSVEDGNFTLSEAYVKSLQQYRGLKIVILQDEYDNTNTAKTWIKRLGIQIVLTCVPKISIEKVYPQAEFPNTQFISVLTGYVSESSLKPFPLKPFSERKYLIGYRGRQLPHWYGELGHEKYIIGEKMAQICREKHIPADIETAENKRIYGVDWYYFIEDCCAMLGTESGANIFDFDGQLKKNIQKELEDNLTFSYEEAVEKYLKPHEGYINMNQVSPKIFEAIAHKTALILFEGQYSGVILPDVHYISLKKDFSNVQDVLDKVKDTHFLSQITQKAYDDVILSGKYSYQKFVALVDLLIEKNEHSSNTSSFLLLLPSSNQKLFFVDGLPMAFYPSNQILNIDFDETLFNRTLRSNNTNTRLFFLSKNKFNIRLTLHSFIRNIYRKCIQVVKFTCPSVYKSMVNLLVKRGFL